MRINFCTIEQLHKLNNKMFTYSNYGMKLLKYKTIQEIKLKCVLYKYYKRY